MTNDTSRPTVDEATNKLADLVRHSIEQFRHLAEDIDSAGWLVDDWNGPSFVTQLETDLSEVLRRHRLSSPAAPNAPSADVRSLQDQLAQMTRERDEALLAVANGAYEAALSNGVKCEGRDNLWTHTVGLCVERMRKAEATLAEARNTALEEAAQRGDAWSVPSNIRLAAGEMTAQEMRTAQAVARGIASAIRALKQEGER